MELRRRKLQEKISTLGTLGLNHKPNEIIGNRSTNLKLEVMMQNLFQPEGELVIRTLAMPSDTNANGDIFGGWLVSQMDLGGGILAKQRTKSRAVTVAIDAMNFIHPVHVGDIVSCFAKIIKIGRTSLKIKVEAWVVSIDHINHQKVTEGIFTYVAIDQNGRPRPVDP